MVMMIHVVDVIKARQAYAEAGRLIDSYVLCAETPEEAVKAVRQALQEMRQDRPGTEVVHRSAQPHDEPLLINANRHVTLGVAQGLSLCSRTTETIA